MCGRYRISRSSADYQKRFPVFSLPPIKRNLDVRPTDPVLVATAPGPGEIMRWGLLPPWAADLKAKPQPINAMAETLAEKPMFKRLFAGQRCVMFGDGFYEWRVVEGRKKKQRVLFDVAGGEPFAFAALWDIWHPKTDAVKSCTLITTSANELARTVHNRMPVILDPAGAELWLNPQTPPEQLQALLVPRPADGMRAAEVEDPEEESKES